MQQTWDRAFEQAIKDGAVNLVPPEAIVRNVSYYLRARYKPEQYETLHFLDAGCGGGATSRWLLEKGLKVCAVDISWVAVKLAEDLFSKMRMPLARLKTIRQASITALPFADGTFDGVCEANVIQHLSKDDRARAFTEISRVLKPGGLFAGYMMNRASTVWLKAKKGQMVEGDEGSVMMGDGRTGYHLTDVGLSHFFSFEEIHRALRGFTVVGCCPLQYTLPKEEAVNRGYQDYTQGMFAAYAIK